MKKLLLLLLIFPFALLALGQEVRLFTKNFRNHTTDTSSGNARLYYLQSEPGTIKNYRGDTLQMIASVYGVQSIKETDALVWYYRNQRFESGLNPEFYKKRIQLILSLRRENQ